MLKKITALLTALPLICTAAVSVQAETAAYAEKNRVFAGGGYYSIVNSCDSDRDISAEHWEYSISDSSPDGSGIACRSANGSDTAWPSVLFENVTVPQGAEALIFWFGQEFENRDSQNFLTDPDAVFQPFFKFFYREPGGSWSGEIPVPGSQADVYFINSENGRVLSAGIDNVPITGTANEEKNWGDFKNGYVVFPLDLLFAEGHDGETLDFKIQILGQNSIYLDSDGKAAASEKKISGNTVITYDNFGFITDMEAFRADCGVRKPDLEKGKQTYSDSAVLYKLGMLPPNGGPMPAVYAAENGLRVSWEPSADASGYAVTSYDAAGTVTASVRTAETEALLETDSAVYVQVLGIDSKGLILSVGEPVRAGLSGDINNDGDVDIRDLIRLKKLLAGSEEYDPAADLNGDGLNGADDLALMRKILLEAGGSETMPELDFEKYEDWALPLGESFPKVGSFGNTDEGATPGENSGSGRLSDGPDKSYVCSLPADCSQLDYYYEGETYAYGIIGSREVFAIKDQNGTLIDTVSGAGQMHLNTGGNDYEVYGVADFSEENDVYGRKVLTVRYDCTGGSFEARLVFGRRSCKVEYTADFSGVISPEANGSYIDRGFINSWDGFDSGVECGWTYPSDGDYPYKTTDSFYTVHRFGGGNRMYTFLQSDNLPDYLWDFYVRYPKDRLPMYFGEEDKDGDTVKYTVVFENCAQGDNPDYTARFEGRDLPAAVGVEPTEENSEASSVFIGDAVKLNLNVTNLEEEETLFSLRYDIRDYYGRMVDEGTFINNTIPADGRLDRLLDINPGYFGMFYLNLMITTERGSYREVYPFMLLEEYDYKYGESSPFGINQILGGEYEPYEDYLDLAGKIGVAVTRGTAFRENDLEMTERFINTARNNGIRLFATGNGSLSYITAMEQFGIDAFNSGNELNLPTISNPSRLDSIFDSYVEQYFMPGYYNIKQRGHNYITAAVSGAQSSWLEKLYTEGLWDKFDTLAVHPYGYPYSPDLNAAGDNIWHVEQALRRTRRAIDSYGEKDFYVTETGYPTQAGFKKAVDLRTQADYNTRSYMLSLAYGAKAVMTYCFTDYSNSGIGVSADDPEFNFGYFYYPDYYGRILPKPAAAAYANMTRQLESVTEAEFSRYDDGDQVRAVTLKTELYGDVTVAWSNCSRQPNDAMPQTRPDRMAAYPWVDRWESSLAVTFDASAERVTVTDLMGNETVYTAENGKVTVPLNGSPVIIKGIK